ncbi:hypothetical protein FRC03_004971 [Tulasnella sp. 419]|nr:hypothetical protein FRC03_004971 [Tulasnella sp. 419]
MSSFRPPTSGGNNGSEYPPPFTATTEGSYEDEYDAMRPTTSAGGRPTTSGWGYNSRPTTSQGGYPHQQTGAQYQHGTYALQEEDEEEYEESDDGDVFAYLPPDTAQQQQLEQYQNVQAQQARLLAHQQQQYPQPFAYQVADSVPATSSYQPSATATSTSPGPLTPSSAPYFAPNQLQQQQSAYYPPIHSSVSSPPETSSTAPPFAYDSLRANSGEQYESYHMTPLSSPSALQDSHSSSNPPLAVNTTRNSREVHVSLPNALDSNDIAYYSDSRSPHDPMPTPASNTSFNLDGSSQHRSIHHDESSTRYRKDSKRTHASSSAGSVDLPHDAGSLKTDISLSNVPPYTPTLPSSRGNHQAHDRTYIDEEEDSPFPEVRASVSNTDDPEMPALTFRMWAMGLPLCLISSCANTFFIFRYPAPFIAPLILLLIAYPLGKFLAYTLPLTTWTIPKRIPFIGGYEFSLNPGPFNIKEHGLIYIMANASITPAYGLNVIVVSEKYYGFHLGLGFSFAFILATQLTGFGLAGMCRRFLVWPASLIWPANLVACTLLNTLHAEDDQNESGGMTRYRFFIITMICAFFWYFFPGFLFQGLSLFSFVCWIRPNNVVVNQLFGVMTGLGMSVLTFDWAQICYIGSPLMIPWWAQVHIFIGFVLFYWILVPIIYYTNIWNSSYLPISANVPFDRFGQLYNVSLIINEDMSFNATKYEQYSELYLSSTYAMTYLLAFMLSTALLVHTVLYHGQALLKGLKKMRVEDDDIHAKLMRNYPEVPDWWYLLFFVTFFCVAIVAIQVRHTDTPVWALFLAVLLPIVYVIPSSYIYAMTGQPVGINLIAEFIPGVLLPGKPIANMIFKCYSVQTMQVALNFIQDLKLGHYIKIPPRGTFMAQAIAGLIASIGQVGTKSWMFANIPDICTPNEAHRLSCPQNEVYFTASVVWGLIGPLRQFGKGSVYYFQLWGLLIGVFLPIPFWIWQRKYPRSWIKYMNIPVLLNGPTYIPPATGINYSSWFATGFVFQYIVRTKNFRWWSKFNYILSAGLDAGSILSILFIFFTLQFPKNGTIKLDWWGNRVAFMTADANGVPYRMPPEGGF